MHATPSVNVAQCIQGFELELKLRCSSKLQQKQKKTQRQRPAAPHRESGKRGASNYLSAKQTEVLTTFQSPAEKAQGDRHVLYNTSTKLTESKTGRAGFMLVGRLSMLASAASSVSSCWHDDSPWELYGTSQSKRSVV